MFWTGIEPSGIWIIRGSLGLGAFGEKTIGKIEKDEICEFWKEIGNFADFEEKEEFWIKRGNFENFKEFVIVNCGFSSFCSVFFLNKNEQNEIFKILDFLKIGKLGIFES
jgi:hypothetical protein